MTSSLLARNELAVHKAEPLAVGDNGVRSEIRPPDDLTSRTIIQFLFQLNDRREFQVPRVFGSYFREARALIEAYDEQVIWAGMIKAAGVAQHGFGIAFVRRVIDDS